MTERINGIDLTKLIQLEGRVVEPVPETERYIYRFWRGAHLGKIALNFIRGDFKLNARQDPMVAHFASHYSAAAAIADEMRVPNPFRTSQFDPDDARAFRDLTGIDETFAFPSIVFAVQNIHAFDLEISEGFVGGWYYPLPLTLDVIDEYSSDAIKGIFDLPDH